MKLLLIISSCFVFSLSIAQSQKKISDFKSNYLNASYDVEISGENINDYQLILDATSLDELSTVVGALIKVKNYPKFISSIDSAQAKYLDFVNIAKTNNIKELDKTLNYTFKADGFFKFGGSWEFHFNKVFTYDFKIISSDDEVEYLLIIRSGELQSSSNEFITMDGLIWAFNSIEEIAAFKEAVALKKIEDYFSAPRVDDLFKN